MQVFSKTLKTVNTGTYAALSYIYINMAYFTVKCRTMWKQESILQIPHAGVQDNLIQHYPLHTKYCSHPHWFLLSVHLLFLKITFNYIYKTCASQALSCILLCHLYGILEYITIQHIPLKTIWLFYDILANITYRLLKMVI